jgi:hypothetical protein
MLDFWSLFPTLIRWKSQMSVFLIYGFPKFLKIGPPAEKLRLLNFPVQYIEKTEGKLYLFCIEIVWNKNQSYKVKKFKSCFPM